MFPAPVFLVASLAIGGDGGPVLRATIRETPTRGQIRGPIAPFPDLDGDGVAECVVGMPEVEFGEIQFGRVVVRAASDGSALRAIEGPQANDHFGASVAAAGDLDGDGVPDLVVGAPVTATATHALAGAVYAISGASGRFLRSWVGDGDSVSLGFAVAACGDLDGDGIPDVALGAPGSSAIAPAGGSVWLGSGASGAVLWRIDGASASAALGFSVVSLGDVDGDGVADLAAGAPKLGALAEGGVEVISGSGGSTLHAIPCSLPFANFGSALAVVPPPAVPSPAGPRIAVGAPGAHGAGGIPVGVVFLVSPDGATAWTLAGNEANGHFGAALACGELDGAGRPEIVIGAPFSPSPSGAPRGSVTVVFDLDPNDTAVWFGSQEGEELGRFVACVELPGPRTAVAAVAPLTNYPGQAVSGSVRLYFPTGALAREYAGSLGGVQLGAALAPVGDVDGDGVGDLAVGVPSSNASGAYASGEVRIVSGARGATIATILGQKGGAIFGAAVTAVGDLDGDGEVDLAVGAPIAKNTQGDTAGAVFLFGAKGNPLGVLEGSQAGEMWGWSVAAAGDVDGDGVPDFAAGAPGAAGRSQRYAGAVRVVSGAAGATLRTLEGDVPLGQFGFAIANVGDGNGDGIPELVVGMPSGVLDAGPSPGFARAFDGSSGAIRWTAEGANPLAAFGWSIAGGESGPAAERCVAVGAPEDVDTRGSATLLALRDGTLRGHLEGEAPSDLFGTAVSFRADFDGDGRTDLVVGAAGATVAVTGPGGIPFPPAIGAGRLSIFPSSSPGASHSFPGIIAFGGLGSTIATLEGGDPSAPAFAVAAPIEAANGVVRIFGAAAR